MIEEDTLAEQNLALAAALPERPLVLGGCCCSHVGAVEGLAARHGRLAIVWFDAHGDLNTPESSPSGNAVGHAAADADRRRAPSSPATSRSSAREASIRPRRSSSRTAGVHTGVEGIEAALDGAEAVYVALDVDVLDPAGTSSPFMPEPDGPTVRGGRGGARARSSPRSASSGAGLTGLARRAAKRRGACSASPARSVSSAPRPIGRGRLG